MGLSIDVEKKQNNTYVVSPKGDIDSETYLKFQQKVKPVLELSPRVIIIDMGDVKYISSLGIGVILSTKKSLEKDSRIFMMINLTPSVKKVFDVVSAIPDMNIFSNQKEADNYLMKLQQKEIEKGKRTDR